MKQLMDWLSNSHWTPDTGMLTYLLSGMAPKQTETTPAQYSVVLFCLSVLFSTWRRGPQWNRKVVKKSYLTCIQRTLSKKWSMSLYTPRGISDPVVRLSLYTPANISDPAGRMSLYIPTGILDPVGRMSLHTHRYFWSSRKDVIL